MQLYDFSKSILILSRQVEFMFLEEMPSNTLGFGSLKECINANPKPGPSSANIIYHRYTK
jgi:hypothetical protein